MNTTSQQTRPQRRRKYRKRKQSEQPQSIKKTKMEHFFIHRPYPHSPTNLTIHNLSNRTLTTEELNILDKGLSFAPTDITPKPKLQLQLLRHFNVFTKSLRQMYVHKQHYTATTNQPKSFPLTTTAKTYRPIKFIPKSTYPTITQQYSGRPKLVQYIETTKLHIDKLLPLLTAPTPPNLTKTEQKTIKTLIKSKSTLTIKPADKNLGIVIMDTDDYINNV